MGANKHVMCMCVCICDYACVAMPAYVCKRVCVCAGLCMSRCVQISERVGHACICTPTWIHMHLAKHIFV